MNQDAAGAPDSIHITDQAMPSVSASSAGAASLAAAALLAACGGGGDAAVSTAATATSAAAAGGDTIIAAATVATAAAATGGETIIAAAVDAVSTANDSGVLDAASAVYEEAQEAPVRAYAAPRYTYTVAKTYEEAARFLLQAQFSASTAEIAEVREIGFKRWITRQYNKPDAETGQAWLDKRGYSHPSAQTSYFDQSYPADFMIWNQLIKSPDAMLKRQALALSEIFVVSLSSIEVEWRSHAIAKYWDTLVTGTQISFRRLLEDITLNPAMGFFLNTRGNQKENAQGRRPDENYAREVMQLFTIGLYKLNQDGTEKLDAEGEKIPSYTPSDVSNLARVFTGYDLDYSANAKRTLRYDGYTREVGNTTPVRRRMVLNQRNHSIREKKFLGTTIAAGTDGETSLRIALNRLFNHPNVGPFIGKQLIQRLVTSNPTPAYVSRVAAAFNDNGEGVRGDMKAVFSAVLLDDEARSPAGLTDPTFGKLREPMVRFVQWARTFKLDSREDSWKLDQQGNADQLGQSPLRAPSVFNYFRPGYVPPSTAIATGGKVAPEFQIVNETTVGAYLNYMQDRIRYGFWVDSPKVPEHNYTGYVRDIAASYVTEINMALEPDDLVRRLDLLLCAGQLPPGKHGLIVDALKATPVRSWSSRDAKLDRVCAAVLMVMASSAYLIQK